MQSTSRLGRFFGLAAAALLTASAAASAQNVQVGRHGTRVRNFDGRFIAAGALPVLIEDPRFCAFAHPNVQGAAPLVIQIVGDVTIVPQQDGSIRIVLNDEDK